MSGVCAFLTSDETATDSECPLEESDYESEDGSDVDEEVLDVEESGLESLIAGQSLEEVNCTDNHACISPMNLTLRLTYYVMILC